MRNMLLYHLSESHEFISSIAGLIKRCIIVVTAHLRLKVRSVVIVCTIHKATGSAAMKHIHVNRDARTKQYIQLGSVLRSRDSMVLFTPPVKPGRIPFCYKERSFAFMVLLNQ